MEVTNSIIQLNIVLASLPLKESFLVAIVRKDTPTDHTSIAIV